MKGYRAVIGGRLVYGTIAYDLALLPIVSIKAKVAWRKGVNIELVVEIN
ncbi:hypothetical protein [Olivibacter ginsenosidimutans]